MTVGLSPVPVLAILAIYGAIYIGLTEVEAAGTENLDQPSDIHQPDGVLDILKEILDAIWGFITKLLGALTFNVDGAPAPIRGAVATIIIGALTWSIVTLIRGN